MITDRLFTLSSYQSVIVGTTTSIDVIDRGEGAARDGQPHDFHLALTVNTAFTGSGTVQILIEGSNDGGTWRELATGPAVAAPLPRVSHLSCNAARFRYLRARYVLTGTLAGGRVTATLGPKADV